MFNKYKKSYHALLKAVAEYGVFVSGYNGKFDYAQYYSADNKSPIAEYEREKAENREKALLTLMKLMDVEKTYKKRAAKSSDGSISNPHVGLFVSDLVAVSDILEQDAKDAANAEILKRLGITNV